MGLNPGGPQREGETASEEPHVPPCTPSPQKGGGGAAWPCPRQHPALPPAARPTSSQQVTESLISTAESDRAGMT